MMGDEEQHVQSLVRKLEAAAHILCHTGWPATFLAMYDEAYQL